MIESKEGWASEIARCSIVQAHYITDSRRRSNPIVAHVIRELRTAILHLCIFPFPQAHSLVSHHQLWPIFQEESFFSTDSIQQQWD